LHGEGTGCGCLADTAFSAAEDPFQGFLGLFSGVLAWRGTWSRMFCRDGVRSSSICGGLCDEAGFPIGHTYITKDLRGDIAVTDALTK